MTNIDKEILRERILNLLRDQKEEDRIYKSLSIGDKLFRIPEYNKAQTILFYASFDGEVDTFEMMKQAQKKGKRVCLPRVIKENREIAPYQVDSLESDLEEGPYGIKQPKDRGGNRLKKEDIDLMVVPGVAFDEARNRLGRGGGYYDRFLESVSSATPIVGLAFDFQIVESLSPTAKHDIPVSHLITN